MGEQDITNRRKKDKAGAGGLRRLFLTMTILPIIVMGIFIIVVDYGMYSKGLREEVRRGLSTAVVAVTAAYDEKYPGDYNLLVDEDKGVQYLKKGDVRIDEDTSLIDTVKQQTGVDITIFFWDTRMMTTIADTEGRRVLGTVAHRVVADKVLSGHEEVFYDNVQVGGRDYFAEYIPIYSESGVCLGMIGAAKPSEEVAATVNRAMLWNVVLIIAAMALVTLIIRSCTYSIVSAIIRVEEFLSEMAGGNLSARVDETVLKRDDEIGEMARFTEYVQAKLRKLIERDALTGLYNRRSGRNKIIKTKDTSDVFAVVMGDIDFFKKVNDTYGHDAGDEVLKAVARILSDNMAGKGFVARWGGEEFLIVFEGIDSEAAAIALNEILEEIRNTTVECGEYKINVTMSYGVTDGNMQTDIDSQIKEADGALYYAKTHGRNRVCVAKDIAEEICEHPDNTL